MNPWQPSFDGLELPQTDTGPITMAAQTMLAHLDKSGLLTSANALDVQIVLSLAATLDRGLSVPKPTVATSTFAKQLHEFIERLPMPSDATNDKLNEFMKALENA
jgi:hypothetical protein